MAAPLYPAKTIANLFNLTERRVQQMAAEGIIPKAERGKYELVGCVRGYIKYLQERAFGKDVGQSDTFIERARLLRAKADEAEIDAKVKGKDYAPISTLCDVIGDFSSQAKAIFESLPKRIKQSMPELRAREIKILERELVKAQNAIAEIQVVFDIEGDS